TASAPRSSRRDGRARPAEPGNLGRRSTMPVRASPRAVAALMATATLVTGGALAAGAPWFVGVMIASATGAWLWRWSVHDELAAARRELGRVRREVMRRDLDRGRGSA